MYNLLRRQSAPEVDIDLLGGNPVDDNFMAIFREIGQSMIANPRQCLARLIKYTRGVMKELVKQCIQQPPELGYCNDLLTFEKKYGDIFRILSSHIKEIKSRSEGEANYAAGYRKFYGFLL